MDISNAKVIKIVQIRLNGYSSDIYGNYVPKGYVGLVKAGFFVFDNDFVQITASAIDRNGIVSVTHNFIETKEKAREIYAKTMKQGNFVVVNDKTKGNESD